MNRVTIVNLAGRAWHVEEDGVAALEAPGVGVQLGRAALVRRVMPVPRCLARGLHEAAPARAHKDAHVAGKKHGAEIRTPRPVHVGKLPAVLDKKIRASRGRRETGCIRARGVFAAHRGERPGGACCAGPGGAAQ